MTAIFEVPELVKKVASLDLSGPVRPIGQDTYKAPSPSLPAPERADDALTLATIARDGLMRRIEALMDAGLTDTTAFRAVVASLEYYNGKIRDHS